MFFVNFQVYGLICGHCPIGVILVGFDFFDLSGFASELELLFVRFFTLVLDDLGEMNRVNERAGVQEHAQVNSIIRVLYGGKEGRNVVVIEEVVCGAVVGAGKIFWVLVKSKVHFEPRVFFVPDSEFIGKGEKIFELGWELVNACDWSRGRVILPWEHHSGGIFS
jgi:hypothetical protein